MSACGIVGGRLGADHGAGGGIEGDGVADQLSGRGATDVADMLPTIGC